MRTIHFFLAGPGGAEMCLMLAVTFKSERSKLFREVIMTKTINRGGVIIGGARPLPFSP